MKTFHFAHQRHIQKCKYRIVASKKSPLKIINSFNSKKSWVSNSLVTLRRGHALHFKGKPALSAYGT